MKTKTIYNDEDATSIAKLIQTGTIQNLTLQIKPSIYQYTPERIIFNSLKNNLTLKSISFDYIESNNQNGIRYKSFIKSVAITLKNNNSIVVISLSCDNKKHVQDTTPLATLLEANKTIKKVNLFFTRYSEKNLSAILKVLNTNNSLTNIHIETYSNAKKHNGSQNYVLLRDRNQLPVTVTTKSGVLFVCKALKGIKHISCLDLTKIKLTTKDKNDLRCFYKNSFLGIKIKLNKSDKALEDEINALAGRHDVVTTLAQGMFTTKPNCLKENKLRNLHPEAFFEISKFIVGEPFELVDKKLQLSRDGKKIMQAQNAVTNIYKNRQPQ